MEEGIGKRDIMIVAHGHFSRVLIARWVQFPICLGTHFNVEPAGVSFSWKSLTEHHTYTEIQIAILSYNHHSLNEPALDAMNIFAEHK